jgi:hypothetical protein
MLSVWRATPHICILAIAKKDMPRNLQFFRKAERLYMQIYTPDMEAAEEVSLG